MSKTQAKLGGDFLSVAENETLDFRKSPRWNQARRLVSRKLVSNGASVCDIAGEVLGCVSKTFVKLRKLMPVDALIAAVLSPWGRPDLLLSECKDAYEYANLIMNSRHSHHDDIGVFLELAYTMVHTFFDQERARLDFSRDPSAFHALDLLRRDVVLEMRPCLDALAQQQAALTSGKNNSYWTRLIDGNRESQEQILTLSLLEN